MKKRLQLSTVIALSLGILALSCRIWLLSGGFDEKGLLIPGHPGIWLCLLLTAAVAVTALLLAKALGSSGQLRFPMPLVSAVGAALAAVGILISGVAYFTDGEGLLHLLCGAAGLLAAAGMATVAFLRVLKKRPGALPYGIVTVFFMLHLYCSYRNWSGEPQLHLILYNMLCLLTLTLTCFHRAGSEADFCTPQSLCASSLFAIFFCLAALPGSGEPLLLLGMTLYLAAELFSARPVRKAERT